MKKVSFDLTLSISRSNTQDNNALLHKQLLPHIELHRLITRPLFWLHNDHNYRMKLNRPYEPYFYPYPIHKGYLSLSEE